MDSYRRPPPPRAMDHGDPRTPMAWIHRDMNFDRSNRPSSSSVTSTSSDDRDQVPMVRRYRPAGNNSRPRYVDRFDAFSTRTAPSMDRFYGWSPYTSGTLRSTRSVPALAMAAAMDDHCPVHGSSAASMRRHGSMFDVRPAPYPRTPLGYQSMDKKSFHGSTRSLSTSMPQYAYDGGAPPYMLPPHLINSANRPSVLYRDRMSCNPYSKSDSFLPSYPTKDDFYSSDKLCCKGHLIVLWIVLGVVSTGVILGVILAMTIT